MSFGEIFLLPPFSPQGCGSRRLQFLRSGHLSSHSSYCVRFDPLDFFCLPYSKFGCWRRYLGMKFYKRSYERFVYSSERILAYIFNSSRCNTPTCAMCILVKMQRKHALRALWACALHMHAKHTCLHGFRHRETKQY